ncbi:MAG: SUMF1/EgtB/PvdO family nonheme iron enzyme [Phycisphaerae bacterium]|jgi:formylglycine-generating enzyme required for sulfatase activity
MSGVRKFVAQVAVLLVIASVAHAVDIQTVTIGNPGNVGEISGASAPGGYGPDRVCGAVDYVYAIGKYEVTAGQYTEFLNAVARTDTYGLYNTAMFSDSFGCRIQRSGSSGSFTYSVAAEWANRPVNYTNWGDAARFVNWLHNGQPSGVQDLTTTEDGSYFLNGAVTRAALLAVVRKPNATWAIPSEDEWYKAAYHYNDGVTGHYYNYPTGSDTTPNNGNPEGDTGNTANYYDGDHTIGAPYWRTEVGFFSLSGGCYGTFDQGGNVWEWNEAVFTGTQGTVRGLRGGSYIDVINDFMNAGCRFDYGRPTHDSMDSGFRVARVPEPGSLLLLTTSLGLAVRQVRR